MQSQETLIREWVKNPTPDSARLLIRTYQESEWRATRIQVLKSLGSFQDSRSFQFLIEVLNESKDLVFQELALLSLANRKSRSARIFLKKFYLRAPESLRPKAAFALGLAQVDEMSQKLLSDFDQAYSKQDFIWLKNIILALGELKEFQALPRLRRLLEQQGGVDSSLELSLAALFALGRLERESETLEKISARFFDDSLLYQVFQNTQAMIQVRSQFKLEDYLSKIFEGNKPHPVLPLELRAFEESEVEVGLSLFPIPQYWRRFLFALRGLTPKLKESSLLQIYQKCEDLGEFLDALAEVELSKSENLLKKIEADQPSIKTDLHLRIRLIQAFAEVLNLESEANTFLFQKDDALSIRFINLWSEVRAAEEKASIEKTLKNMTGFTKLSDAVLARLLRAFAELSIPNLELTSEWKTLFKRPSLRSSLLLYAERFSIFESLTEIEQLTAEEREALGSRVLAVLEVLAPLKSFDTKIQSFEKIISTFKNHFNVEFRQGVLRTLRTRPLASFESWVMEQTQHQNGGVELNAIITLKSYPHSRNASDVLAEKLETSKSEVIVGRVLDSLCAHSTLVAKRAVLIYLKKQILNEEVVDKVYRSFDPENKGGDEFVKELNLILKSNPDHPSWEKLLSLRDRLSEATVKPEVGSESGTQTSPELERLDQRLLASIPKFKDLDGTTKLALRAAEQPFMQEVGSENLPIDKAPTVLEYCKALDLILEKHLGQKILFPKLDRELHDFQTFWHRVGFGEEYPDVTKVMSLLGLKGKITPENFPLHKARMMCGTFFNGKIVQDRFKIFDGLRAWAVIFLFFTRKVTLNTGVIGPLLKLPNASDEKSIAIAKKLMQLQDLRNPAAHRQTYTDLSSVQAVRNESVELINTILELVL